MVKKICKYLTLGTLGVVGGLLIFRLLGLLFNLEIFKGWFWQVVGTFGVIFAIAILGISVAELLEKKNPMALVSFILMGISGIILLILIWNAGLITQTNYIDNQIKIKGSWTIALTSFLITLFLNPIFKLGKRCFVLKLVTWIFLAISYIAAMCLVMTSAKGFSVNGYFLVLVLGIPTITMVVLEIVCSVIGKSKKEAKVDEVIEENHDEVMTIKKSEYNEMVSKIQELEAEIEKLKVEKI